jgi:hypothetical protein
MENEEFKDDDIDSEIDMYNESNSRMSDSPNILGRNEVCLKLLNERKNLLAKQKEV